MKNMSPRINWYAEESDFIEVKKAIKETKDTRMHIRYTVILNFLQGRTYKEIASIFSLSIKTVGDYIRKYKAHGLTSLTMGKSTGAPRQLDKSQEEELINIILTKTPDEVGFISMKNWDTNIIRQLTARLYGISYCQRGMLEVLYRNGLSYTRPTYSLVNADPAKQEEFKKEFELLKKI